MIIDHPLLGPRDASEFTYLGDAALLDRPDTALLDFADGADGADRADGAAANAIRQFHDYLYLRDNIAGQTRELWFHEAGDGSWLVVTRDTVTHEIAKVEMARDVALAKKHNDEAK